MPDIRRLSANALRDPRRRYSDAGPRLRQPCDNGVDHRRMSAKKRGAVGADLDANDIGRLDERSPCGSDCRLAGRSHHQIVHHAANDARSLFRSRQWLPNSRSIDIRPGRDRCRLRSDGLLVRNRARPGAASGDCAACPTHQIGLETTPQINNVTTARNTRLDYSHVYANRKRN